MKALALALLALALAGCEHMYGGVDMGRFAGPLTPDLEHRIVERAARATDNRNYLQEGDQASVRDCGVYWCVRFGPTDPSILDGGSYVRIHKVTGVASRRSSDA